MQTVKTVRTFESSTPKLFYGIVGGSAVVAAALVAMENVVLSAVILVGALGYLGWDWYNGERMIVLCDGDGFAVTHASRRRGSRTERYRWAEVTGTEVYHTSRTRHRDGQTETSHTGHFALYGEQGTLLDWSAAAGFDDLMATVNERTPHLEYIWVKREDATGPVVEEAGPYVAVQR